MYREGPSASGFLSTSVGSLRRVHGVPLDRLRLPWDVYGTFWGDLAPQAPLDAQVLCLPSNNTFLELIPGSPDPANSGNRVPETPRGTSLLHTLGIRMT